MSQEDRAQEQEVFHWEMANRARPPAKVFEPGEPGYGPALCTNLECEEPLPAARRSDGQRLCTECKGLAERRAKRGF